MFFLQILLNLHLLHLVNSNLHILVTVAQLVERLRGRQEVAGSNRTGALSFWRKISRCLADVLFPFPLYFSWLALFNSELL